MWRVAVVIIVALSVTIPCHAKPKKTKKYQTTPAVEKEQKATQQKESFSPAERNLIRSHLLGKQETSSQKKHKELPPGLQKKVARGKALPPGWQKKIAPGQSLDYQVYRQGVSLPDILMQRLPPTPIGSEILQVEDKVILVNSATRTILDAFNLIPTP